jgi:multiple sugar transport system permease protein
VIALSFTQEEGLKWWNLGSASAVAFVLFLVIFGVTVVQLRLARWEHAA